MIRVVALLVLFAGSAHALDLSLPNATVTQTEQTDAGSVRLPQVPWASDQITEITEGRILRQAMRLPQADITTLQLIQPLRQRLQQEGYTEVFSCADASCGGFDFRFQLDLLPAPDMYVDLGDYRYVLMTKEGGEPHTVSLVASRSTTAGFVHTTEVFTASFPEPEPVAPTATDTLDPDGLINTLTTTGHVVLEDLEFVTGSAELGAVSYGSLQVLSLWLETNPGARVVLVGHTDSVGSLEANTDLSRRRASAVTDRLTTEFGVDPVQLDAAGAGYLSPIASNLTEDGRATNRRVEVVLLSLDQGG